MKLAFKTITCFPVSAKNGDNCVTKSPMGDQKSKFTVKSDGDTFTGNNAEVSKPERLARK